MTAEETRRKRTPEVSGEFWLREIAAQLAELNAFLKSKGSGK